MLKNNWKKHSCFQLGANSGLHIIIFDELDAICKQRGTGASSTGVHDTVVNQLLSKIDGVEQLNNILVIGKDWWNPTEAMWTCMIHTIWYLFLFSLDWI